MRQDCRGRDNIVIAARQEGWKAEMTEITLSLTPELLARLTAIASDKELSLDECAIAALIDYVEAWEDFNRTVEALESGEEERTVLRAVNE
jgi:hypothetical protein